MFPISANQDLATTDTFIVNNEYYDWDASFTDKELWGADALNQSIEMVLTTEPQERLFNLDFGSPLFSVIFENANQMGPVLDHVFDVIEYWVPITINRAKTNIQVNSDAHTVSFEIPYTSKNGIISGYFARKISK